MFGYITKKEAESLGCTHHGKIYSIPVWTTDQPLPLVISKITWLETLIEWCRRLDIWSQTTLNPDDLPKSSLIIIKPIKDRRWP